MAITIQTHVAKKVPIPGAEYSSQQASITISAEVTDLSQVVAEAAKLYHIAELAVDQQLGVHPQPAPSTAAPSAPSRTASPRPSAASPAFRRSPSPVTDSQLRFLRRLIDRSGVSMPGILEEHRVESLEQLSCRAAATVIDDLKSRVPA